MSPIVQVIYNIVYHGMEKLGRYYSEYPGYVFDNKDPDNLCRVRLIIPGIADNPMDDWAWPKDLFAGPGFGAHCIPPEGSVVWVSFRLGDPNHPLWFHGHYGYKDVEDWTDKQKRTNNFWFKTPQGSIIEMDDNEGTIRVTDATGNQIQTSAKGISIIPAKGASIFNGSLDKGDEGTAMGKTTQKIVTVHHKSLLGAISSLSDLSENLGGMMAKMALATTPIGAAAILISDGLSIANSASNVVKNNKTLNKSLTGVNKDLTKIPSTKVFLDR